MGFSVLSWNIEHFKGGAARLKKVADHIRGQNPDVFGLLEIENADVKSLVEAEFPGYDFALTDGPEVQEILVAWRRSLFDQATFTQKREFNVGNAALRPGALLSLRQHSVWYNLLYLHTDSGTDAPAFGNRVEMFDKTWKLKGALDRKLAGASRLVVLGDLNTMGLMFPKPTKKNLRVSHLDEIAALGESARKSGMLLLEKDQVATWKGSAGESNLDHVLVSEGLPVAALGSRADGAAFQVQVRGWPQLAGAAQTKYLAEISDHASLFLKVG